MEHKTVIRFLAVFLIIISVLILLSNVAVLFSQGYKNALLEEGYNYDFPFGFLAVSKILISVLMLIGVMGLVKLKDWGRQSVIVALILFFVVYAITSWLELKSRVEYAPLPALVFIFGLPIYYLSRKNVLKCFSRGVK